MVSLVRRLADPNPISGFLIYSRQYYPNANEQPTPGKSDNRTSEPRPHLFARPGFRKEIGRQKQNSQTRTFVQVSAVLDLSFTPVGLPASANVSYLLVYRPSRDVTVAANIRWNLAYSGLGGASGGFGSLRLS